MANKIINIQSLNPSTFQFQDYSKEDDKLISNSNESILFDSKLNYIEYFISDLNSNLLFDNTSGFSDFQILDGLVTIDPEKNLTDQGFSSGQYYTIYNFLKRLLSSSPNVKYYIEEISSDRTEIRLNSNTIPKDLIISSANELKQYIDTNDGSYKDFYLNFGANKLIIANNILLDNGNQLNPSILIKLYEPLSNEFNLKDELWVVEKIAESKSYQIEIIDLLSSTSDIIYLQGPNLNLDIKDEVNNSTEFKDYNSLVSSNSTSSLNQLSSLLEEKGIEINVDYTDYSNFVFLSNAEQRLNNFYYKIGLLEDYTSDLTTLYSITSSNSSSIAVSSSKVILENKISELITNLDGYEYFLYYESSSFTYPKSNSVYPYTLYLSTSPTAQTWISSSLLSASIYDLNNRNSLLYSIPDYLRDDSDNSQNELFVGMLGQHFDNIWIYIKDITNKFNSDNRINYGISKDLTAQALRDLGLKIYQNNFNNDDLYAAFLGVTPSGSLFPSTGSEWITNYITGSQNNIPLDDINKRLYKRLYHNLPYLYKTKGTLTGLEVLLSSYGIPNTILKVTEFGGKDKNNNNWDFWGEKFNYEFYTSGSSYVRTEWNKLSSSLDYPGAIEFRFKTPILTTSTPLSQSLFYTTNGDTSVVLEYSGSINSSASYSGAPINSYNQYGNLKLINSGSTISASIYLPFFNNGWWSVLVNRVYNGTNYTYTLYAKDKIYNEENGNTLGFQGSSSFTGSNWGLGGNGRIYLPSDVPVSILGKTYTPFTGSYQELRLYTTALSESVFDNYVMNPYSIEGNKVSGSQSSFNILSFRAPLGTVLDNDSTITTRTSIHPSITGSSSTTQSFSGSNSSYNLLGQFQFSSNCETIFIEEPLVGIKNSISNKIQIGEQIIPSGSTLSPFISIQQNPSVSGSYTKDINYLEVAFSPQNEINDDISSQLGFFNIGDYIGDPRQVSSSLNFYPNLNLLRDKYFEKYIHNYNFWDYIRLIKYFDNSLFKMIKDFVPARTSLSSGIVIKQHLLERTKYPLPQLTQSFYYLTASIGNIEGLLSGSKIYSHSRDYESFPLEVFSGGTGGAMPNLSGSISSSNLFANITQSWSGVNDTRLGLVPYTHNTQDEFYNGEFSGSIITVATQSLHNCDIFNNLLVTYDLFFYSSNVSSSTSDDNFLNPITSPNQGQIYLLYDSSSIY